MDRKVNIKFMFLLAFVFFQDLNLHNGAIGAEQTSHCAEGEYLHQTLDTSSCAECPDGTFMPWKNHTAHECFECAKIEDAFVEVLISKCDKFHDADIQCVEGYFRRVARNPRDKPSCLKCTPACHDLFFEVHPCANFSDIGCCPGENYDYYTQHGVRMCRERPWMCRQGQYLDVHLNDCKPCPENTFMSAEYHSHTKCWDCTYNSEAYLPLHTVITKPCTSTQPPQYRCKDGFYISRSMSYRGDDIGCSQCQACGHETYEVRPCNTSHNTLCCSKPTMIEVDGKCAEADVKGFEQSTVCMNGTYNPPACDRNCSEHCRVSERSDQSPCDQSNGTCLFGCTESYVGSGCKQLHSQSTEVRGESVAKVIGVIIFIAVIGLFVVIMSILYQRHSRRLEKKGNEVNTDKTTPAQALLLQKGGTQR